MTESSDEKIKGAAAQQTDFKRNQPIRPTVSDKELFVLLQRLDQLVHLANQKASIQLGAIVLILVTAFPHISAIKNIITASCPLVTGGILLLTVLAAFTNVLFNILTIKPITITGESHGKYISLIAFGSIAKMTPETYQTRLKSNDYSLSDDLILQIHQLAQICDIKFLYQKRSVFSLIIITSGIFSIFLTGLLR